jgi:CRP-like cAMP-binding protein
MADKLSLNNYMATVLPKALRIAGLLPDMKAEEIPSLFPESGFINYAPYERIIEQDTKGKDLYILCSGQVVITKTFGSAGLTLATLDQGAVFGEMALLRDGIRAATVIAQTMCLVFCIAAQDMQAILRSHPQVGTMLQELAARRSQ